ncbi:MAG: hypothetical protein A3F84_25480 [Candidatus Handelsmanbacteria bacterium RIFCSPLOWO2_12_FULL_64_10]|uniref:BioF2-like acetyltransferase domain-containing protein n=1 Tax=Handelsmanbacteria sp. (strain RIFCSPLOWO2_12_FULL_64_10) TaxID=1817868 RepID=A0A1F6C9Z8_HANXR|nr:MAG: hypothetical protein A3F84_25480 [Candidatus Handelsmanbacteria bacterium RIFCSPLOWO2_12_FULL_64_10]
MDVTIWDQSDAFQRLEQPWKRLFDDCPDAPVFLSWEWTSTWWTHFHGDCQPHIMTFNEGDELVAVVPLMVDTGGAPTIRFMGSSETTDYADILAADGHSTRAAEALVECLREAAEQVPLVLEPIPEESPLLKVVRDSPDADAETTKLEPCPTATLADSWEGYLATLSKTDRHELRRKMRRADSAGNLHVEVFTESESLAAALPSFYHLHRSSGNVRKAQFLEPRIQAFFSDVALALAERQWVRLAMLYLDDREIASVLSFDRGSTVGLYNSGYDAEFRPMSPGIVVIALELKAAIERGRSTYDFLRGDEPYKYDFGAHDRFVWRVNFGIAARASLQPDAVGSRE